MGGAGGGARAGGRRWNLARFGSAAVSRSGWVSGEAERKRRSGETARDKLIPKSPMSQRWACLLGTHSSSYALCAFFSTRSCCYFRGFWPIISHNSPACSNY
uniref:Uncharacterized protein n=1 Tax=Xenopus tropicalis TaxID=8364 RepID=A0A1B8Y7U7_XENTR